jgi:glycosyltransferase involved in cell wall biosynthesis
MDTPVTPLISVVIPAFNRRLELNRALESLVEQSSKNFETIVCDDGSSEDLKEIVDAYLPILDIHYIRIENSGGPARPRNTAVAKARGEWISFLDSDDWWDKDRIERVEFALQADVDFVYHPLRVVTSSQINGRRELRRTIGEPLRCEALSHMALYGNPIPNSAAVVRRSLLDKIGGICEDRNLVALEDFDTWMRLAECGVTPRFIEQPLGSYWIGEDGISNITENHFFRQITLFNRHQDEFDSTIRSMAESRQNYVLGTMAMHLVSRQNEARSYLYRAGNLPTFKMKLYRLIKIIMTFKNGMH